MPLLLSIVADWASRAGRNRLRLSMRLSAPVRSGSQSLAASFRSGAFVARGANICAGCTTVDVTYHPQLSVDIRLCYRCCCRCWLKAARLAWVVESVSGWHGLLSNVAAFSIVENSRASQVSTNSAITTQSIKRRSNTGRAAWQAGLKRTVCLALTA